jgi:hypothetical protein
MTEMMDIVGMLVVEAEAAASASLNAKRKDVKFKLGAFVMLHAPIRTKGAASRLTENWIGPFVVTADNGHKNYAIQHIDAGTTARHGVHNLCALPPELFKGEYHERLVAMRRKDPLPSTSINAKDMPLVKTLRGVCLAGVWQVLDDAAIHVHWYNGVHGRLQPPARVCPAYLGESAKLREVFTMPPTKDQALQPVWGIIACRQVIGQPLTLQEKKTDHLFLPTSARTTIADWLRSDPAQLPKKVSPKVSTTPVDTATPTLSCVSCKSSPPCSTLN